jgi:ABC-type glycerol-3-phosphate transport system substrate-binding protein
MSVKKLSRRELLKGLGVAAVGGVLAACQPQVVKETVVVEKPVEKVVKETVVVTEEKVVKETVVVEKAVEKVVTATPVPTVDPRELTGTFTFAAHNDIEAPQALLDHFFGENYPKMKAVLEVTPWGDGYFIKVQSQIAAGNPPDGMLMHESFAWSFAGQDLLLPLDDFQATNPMPGEREEYAGIDQLVYRGKTYVWPSSFANYGIVYNKDIFDAAGVDYPEDDWTWEDLYEIGVMLSDPPDVWGFTNGGFDNTGWAAGWYPILKAYGGEMFDDTDTICLLDSPEAIQTFDYMRRMWCDKVVPPPATAQQLGGAYGVFLEGRSAMNYFYTGFCENMHENRQKDFEYGLAACPRGPRGRFIRIGGSQYAIPAGSKYPEAAWEFMRFALGTEQAQQIAVEATGTHMNQSRIDLFRKFGSPQQPEVVAMVPNWEEVAVDKAVQYGVFVRYSKIGGEFNPMIAAETDSLADCSKTAEEVAQIVTDRANQMFKEFGT